MNLEFTDEQNMLRESAFAFVREEYDFADRKASLSEVSGYRPAVWQQLAELGWLGWPIPERHGGFGGSRADVAIIAEALGSRLVVEPYLECAVVAAGVLAKLGTEQQQEQLAEIAAGQRLAVLAHEEPGSRSTSESLSTVARRDGERWVIDGAKSTVVSASAADLLLVSARLGDEADAGLGIFQIPRDAPGMTLSAFPILDGRHAADVALDGVRVDDSALLGGRSANAAAAIGEALDVMTALACAQVVGALDELLRETRAYVDSRVQFGRPLGQFQVVQHRLAEMRTLSEEARAITLMAVLRLDAARTERERAVSAAKFLVAKAGRYVAQQAVQLHGGMGVSDELKIATYLKFVTTFQLMFGAGERHLERYRGLLQSGRIRARDAIPLSGGVGADELSLDLTAEQTKFRSELRDFLDAELPENLVRATRLNVAPLFEPAVGRPWHQILHRNGMSAPEWPDDLGGRNWDPIQHYLWRVESWRAGAPQISQIGMRLVAPILIEYGTDDQKSRFLPALLSGDACWCQGFSEPQAGSDLAALRCTAVADGDDYVVSGTKLWQTHAQFADSMILLARTSDEDRRKDGISCFLMDMSSPGVDVQPIITIGGDHEVNQVFLDNVRIPARNRVGAEGEGWSIAMHLLAMERASSGNAAGRLRFLFDEAQRLIGDREPDGRLGGARGLELSRMAIEIDTVEMLELMLIFAARNEDDPGVLTSIIKLRASRVEQDLCELALHALGRDALRWHPQRPLYELDDEESELQRLAVAPRYFNSRIRTIFGGASEVQLGIIAKAPLR